MTTHSIGRPGPDDYAGAAENFRDRETKRFPGRDGDPEEAPRTNDDIERLTEPVPEESA